MVEFFAAFEFACFYICYLKIYSNIFRDITKIKSNNTNSKKFINYICDTHRHTHTHKVKRYGYCLLKVKWKILYHMNGTLMKHGLSLINKIKKHKFIKYKIINFEIYLQRNTQSCSLKKSFMNF